MKKLLLLLLLILGAVAGFNLGNAYKKETERHVVKKKKINTISSFVKKVPTPAKSLFVPYWSLKDGIKNVSEYDTLIYFGITPNYQGINKSEQGYAGLPVFLRSSAGKKKLLTLRMLNDELNSFVLKNNELQRKIISETLELLDQNSLDGVVLDLEISGLHNEVLTMQINEFVKLFYSEAKLNYRQFYLAVYGDNFYRKRPFDLLFLNKYSDGIMIMAYDFHKSRGEPGPNFPFSSGRHYAYDFKKMISDFLIFVPEEKITVIFGMYGYDWIVDEKKRPITQAKALSLNEIRQKFLDKCEFKNCVVKRDSLAKESEVNYVISASTPDEQQIYRIDYHIVWFEDEESIRIKTGYLQEQGIGRISFWANSYF